MAQHLKLLIVGGYGVFGGRIVALLEDDPRLTLLVAGRSLDRASAFCKTRGATKAQLVPLAFDRNGGLDAQIAAERPDILVDASGPFQAYGGEAFDLVQACIRHGVSYLDLADGSDFVAGVSKFEHAARDAGVFVLSGVSSFPVLTAAVVRRLARDMARIDVIRGGIAPSPYAGVGENVIRAISSYAGQLIELRRNGDAATGYPLAEQMRYTIAPPGRLPLHNTLFSLVDVPDLRVLPELWPQAKTVWMGAGPVPEVLHRTLIALAWLVRLKLLASLLPLSRLIHWASNRLPWGEHRGGMFVEVEGAAADGTPVKRSWHLLAEGDDGPLIPSMAVQGIVRKVLADQPPDPGARAAVHDLDLDDYEQLFAGRRLHQGVREDGAGKPCLYAALLGNAWKALPGEIRGMHDVTGVAVAEGRATVRRGRSPLARLVGALIGFPAANEDVPVQVKFEAAGGEEIWTRRFGRETFSSRQFAGRGRSERLLCEGFGPLVFAMALVVEGDRLQLVLRHWSIFGMPLPLWLAPRSHAYESSEDGRFHFHVEISHPLTGLIVKYSGWLAPAEDHATASKPDILPTE
jgi:Domain of unknown function (DUF4166)/Saccharopine dehydrogenase NADP binding domain